MGTKYIRFTISELLLLSVPQQRGAAALAGGAVRLPAEAGDRLHDGRPHRHRRRLRLPPRVHRRVVTAGRGIVLYLIL